MVLEVSVLEGNDVAFVEAEFSDEIHINNRCIIFFNV